MRLIFAVICVASLGGCATGGAQKTDAPSTVRTTPIPYTLDARGVQLSTRAQRIDFGRTSHSTERAMTKLVGQAPVSRGVCPDGRPRVTWADGTVLYFSGGAFRGWAKPDADGTVRRSGIGCA